MSTTINSQRSSLSALPSSTAPLVIPLTTVFTPAPECTLAPASSFNSCEFPGSSIPSSSIANNAIPICRIPYTPVCFPTGFGDEAVFYSPGVCPRGYTAITDTMYLYSPITSGSDVATTSFCCPSAMELASLSNRKVCMSVGSAEYITHQVMGPSGVEFEVEYTSALSATSGAVALYQAAVTVAWASTDLKHFTPASAPLLSRSAAASSSASALLTDSIGGSSAADSLTTGEKTGIGVGAVTAGLTIIALLCWFVFSRKWNNKQEMRSKSSGSAADNQSKAGNVVATRSPSSSSASNRGSKNSKLARSWRLWRQVLLNTWFPEIVAVVFSTACLFAIVVVLGVHDGQLKTTLGLGITLNALVAILSTASKASLLFAVAAAIGQLRWIRLTKSRRLEEIAIFDEASRGPLGAATLLGKLHVKSWGTIGATITILALAFEPLVQQVLKYPVRNVTRPDSNASAATASIFAVSPHSNSFQFALNSAVWTIDGSIYEQTPNCPTGNCDWPSYTSMGWCSKCANVTSSSGILSSCDLRGWRNGSLDKLDCEISLGDGNSLTAIHGFQESENNRTYRRLEWITSAVWTVVEADSYSFDFCTLDKSADDPKYLGIKNPMLVLAYAHSPNAEFYQSDAADWYEPANQSRYSVEVCALSLCTQNHKLEMRDGLLKHDVSDIKFGGIGRQWVVTSPDTAPGGPSCAECWQPDPNEVTYNRTTADSMPGIDSDDRLLPSYTLYVNKTQHAFCSDESMSFYQSNIAYLLSGGSTYAYKLAYSNLSTIGMSHDMTNNGVMTIVQQMGLKFTMEQIAASLTKLGLDTSNETVFGNVTSAEVFVQVRWAWLSLPLGLEALGIIFLAVVIILGRKHHASLWKCSFLPLIFHALEGDALESTAELSNIDAMEDKARRVMARISNVAGGEKFVVASQ